MKQTLKKLFSVMLVLATVFCSVASLDFSAVAADYADEAQVEAMDDAAIGEARYKLWRNYCISDGYEPGSSVKTMSIATGLETGKVRDSDGFTCVGVLHVGDHDIKCSNNYGHGWLSTEQSLMKSCNAALMQMAMRIGVDDFMNFFS